MNKRKFIQSNAAAAILISGETLIHNFFFGKIKGNEPKSYFNYIRNSALPKEELDIFLNENSWAQFDPGAGYILDMNRYFIGHYTPAGNHFFAYSTKNIWWNGWSQNPLPTKKMTTNSFVSKDICRNNHKKSSYEQTK